MENPLFVFPILLLFVVVVVVEMIGFGDEDVECGDVEIGGGAEFGAELAELSAEFGEKLIKGGGMEGGGGGGTLGKKFGLIPLNCGCGAGGIGAKSGGNIFGGCGNGFP